VAAWAALTRLARRRRASAHHLSLLIPACADAAALERLTDLAAGAGRNLPAPIPPDPPLLRGLHAAFLARGGGAGPAVAALARLAGAEGGKGAGGVARSAAAVGTAELRRMLADGRWTEAELYFELLCR
jgi:hypothetical protein